MGVMGGMGIMDGGYGKFSSAAALVVAFWLLGVFLVAFIKGM